MAATKALHHHGGSFGGGTCGAGGMVDPVSGRMGPHRKGCFVDGLHPTLGKDRPTVDYYLAHCGSVLREDDLIERAAQGCVVAIIAVQQDQIGRPSGRDPPHILRPISAALPSVAMTNAARALTHSAGSDVAARLSVAASRIASNMFCPSEVLLASVPIPSPTPATCIRCRGATPEPSLRLLMGLCEMPAPCPVSRAISGSDSQTPCAPLKRSESTPRS